VCAAVAERRERSAGPPTPRLSAEKVREAIEWGRSCVRGRSRAIRLEDRENWQVDFDTPFLRVAQLAAALARSGKVLLESDVPDKFRADEVHVYVHARQAEASSATLPNFEYVTVTASGRRRPHRGACCPSPSTASSGRCRSPVTTARRASPRACARASPGARWWRRRGNGSSQRSGDRFTAATAPSSLRPLRACKRAAADYLLLSSYHARLQSPHAAGDAFAHRGGGSMRTAAPTRGGASRAARSFQAVVNVLAAPRGERGSQRGRKVNASGRADPAARRSTCAFATVRTTPGRDLAGALDALVQWSTPSSSPARDTPRASLRIVSGEHRTVEHVTRNQALGDPRGSSAIRP